MSKGGGFIKLHRKMQDWEWYSDPVVRSVFIHLLLSAEWEPGEYHGVQLKPGDVATGRKKLAETLGFSERQIRTALKKLTATNELTIKTTNKFSVATIEKWAMYQSVEEKSTNKSTSKSTTSKEDIRNNKNIYSQSVYMNNYTVQNALSQEETDRLTDIYSDLPGLLAEVDAKIRARQRQTEIKKPYAYVVRAAREMDWPTVEEAERKSAKRKKHEEELEAAAKPEELTPEQKAKAKELRERRKKCHQTERV